MRLKLLCWIALLCTFSSAEELCVFYPSFARPQMVQKELSTIFPHYTVTVYARFSDFQAKVETDSPAVILSRPQVLEQFFNYRQILAGTKNGDPLDPYVLLSVDRQVDTTQLERLTVGTVDLLGKTGTEYLIARLFSCIPKIKRVAKIEDLIPLLTFNMADAILVTGSQVSSISRLTQLSLATTDFSQSRSGRIGFAVLKGKPRGKGSLAVKIPVLEVDGWKLLE